MKTFIEELEEMKRTIERAKKILAPDDNEGDRHLDEQLSKMEDLIHSLVKSQAEGEKE